MPPGVAHQVGALPPVSTLFAAFLGINPIEHLLAARGGLAGLPAAARQTLTGREFFPGLISGPFHHGLVIVFALAAVLSRPRRPGVGPARRPPRSRASRPRSRSRPSRARSSQPELTLRPTPQS